MEATKFKLEEELRALQSDPEYVAGDLAADIAEQILRALNNRQGENTQAWLADQMGMTRQRVSYILAGPPNMTLLTLAKMSLALGMRPEVHIDRNLCSYSLRIEAAMSRPSGSYEEQKVNLAISPNEAVYRRRPSTGGLTLATA